MGSDSEEENGMRLSGIVPLLRGVPKRVLEHRLEFLAFFFAFGIRLIPEILSWPDPLGFDTVTWLAPFMQICQEDGLGEGISLIATRQGAPFAFLLFGFVASLTGAHPLLLTKITAPFLFGFLVWSFFYFSKKLLGWSEKKVLLASVVLSLYFIPLRLSWDLYRNLLGLAFLLIALSHSSSLDLKRDRAIFAVFSLLAIFTHELVAVLVLLLYCYLFFLRYWKHRKPSPMLLVCALVATLFVLFYAHWLFPPTGATILSSRPIEPIEFPVDYLSARGPYSYANLGEIYGDVLALALLSFLPLFPLCVKGFFRNKLLDGWCVILSVGSFSVLSYPTMAIPLWNRWMFMLIFPVVIYGTNSLFHLDKKKIALYLSALIVLSSAFIALPSERAFPYFSMSHTVRYVPSSMLQNTVPLSDSDDVRSVLRWLDQNAEENSTLLAHYAFVGWAELYTRKVEIVSYFTIDEVEQTDLESSSTVYTIWWERGTGWYQEQTPSLEFSEVHKSGRIAIYERSM
ncbi:MAG: hypothetical protein ACE5KV_08105 [Thermoplasmata archaeon]